MVSKKTGSVTTNIQVGYDEPVQEFKVMSRNDLADYEGPIGETGVLLGLSLPLPGSPGQKMGPWAKIDVTVTMPVANNKEDLKAMSKFCEEYAGERLTEISTKILNRQS